MSYGFVSGLVQLGFNNVLIKPKRGITNIVGYDGTVYDDIIAQATISEDHMDEMVITENPVEQGAAVNDHIYNRPAILTLRLGWSDSPSSSGSIVDQVTGFATAQSKLASQIVGGLTAVTTALSVLNGSSIPLMKAIYGQLLALKANRALFDVYTGKRTYSNMVCGMLQMHDDEETANSMFITMQCKQMIIVNTQTVSLPSSKQANPSSTASVVQKGVKQLIGG